MKFLVFFVVAVCFVMVLSLIWLSMKLLKDTRKSSQLEMKDDEQNK